ncbi:hypothetical protein [Paenibacillus germinis]|nr:hypothetical protein [Paenibacillus germinis]
MAKKGQTFNKYTKEFKIAAVKEYMKGSAIRTKILLRQHIRPPPHG